VWPALTRLPSQLHELIQLLREQNQLTRELIFALTKEPASTRQTPIVNSPKPRIRTELDVKRFSAADYLADQAADREKREAPWRDPSPPPAPTPTPNPLVPEILDPVVSPRATAPSGPGLPQAL